MYFLVLFEPTGQRSVYQNDKSSEKLTVKDLLEWISKQFHFESNALHKNYLIPNSIAQPPPQRVLG